MVLINPEIVKRSGIRECEEGCLSLPGYRARVQRSEKVVVKAQNRDGRPVRYHATDLFAEAIEHEVDHLNGALYFDLLDSIDELVAITPEEEAEAADADTGHADGASDDGSAEEEVAAKGS